MARSIELADLELHVLGRLPILVVDVSGDPSAAVRLRLGGPLDPEELVGQRGTRLLGRCRRLHTSGGLGRPDRHARQGRRAQ